MRVNKNSSWFTGIKKKEAVIAPSVDVYLKWFQAYLPVCINELVVILISISRWFQAWPTYLPIPPPVYLGVPKSYLGSGLLSASAAAGCLLAWPTEPLPGSCDTSVSHCVSGSNASIDMDGRSRSFILDMIMLSLNLGKQSAAPVLCDMIVCVCRGLTKHSHLDLGMSRCFMK